MSDSAGEILKMNYGFPDDPWWLQYARTHGFKRVDFQRVERCPDCDGARRSKVGQFVYYSTLHSMVECRDCRLCYVDVLIDGAVRQSHFEQGYKSDDYFREARQDIFREAAEIVAEHSPCPSSLLEIGGATGEFSAVIANRFPGTQVTLNDISAAACEKARARGFEAFRGSIPDLASLSPFPVVTALDVLYYEERIRDGMETLARVVSPGGLLLLRLPNKLASIKLASRIERMVTGGAHQTRLRFFNPEHLFIFSQTYILQKLRALGFHDVRIRPSAVLRKPAFSALGSLLNVGGRAAHRALGFVVTPSMFVIAKKGERVS